MVEGSFLLALDFHRFHPHSRIEHFRTILLEDHVLLFLKKTLGLLLKIDKTRKLNVKKYFFALHHFILLHKYFFVIPYILAKRLYKGFHSLCLIGSVGDNGEVSFKR